MDEANELPDKVAKVYQYLIANAFVENERTLWRGHGTQVAKELRLNLGYYYRCLTILEQVESIKKLKHGSNQSPSLYEILKPPEGAAYHAYRERSTTIDRARAPSKYDKLQDSITRLTNRVYELERVVERLTRGHDV